MISRIGIGLELVLLASSLAWAQNPQRKAGKRITVVYPPDDSAASKELDCPKGFKPQEDTANPHLKVTSVSQVGKPLRRGTKAMYKKTTSKPFTRRCVPDGAAKAPPAMATEEKPEPKP